MQSSVVDFIHRVTAPFNNLWTLKFKTQPKLKCVFRCFSQMFGGCFQLPTTAERAVSDNETVLGSSRKPGEVADHLIDGSQNAFVGWALNFRVRVLLKGAVTISPHSACGVFLMVNLLHFNWKYQIRFFFQKGIYQTFVVANWDCSYLFRSFFVLAVWKKIGHNFGPYVSE